MHEPPTMEVFNGIENLPQAVCKNTLWWSRVHLHVQALVVSIFDPALQGSSTAELHDHVQHPDSASILDPKGPSTRTEHVVGWGLGRGQQPLNTESIGLCEKVGLYSASGKIG